MRISIQRRHATVKELHNGLQQAYWRDVVQLAPRCGRVQLSIIHLSLPAWRPKP